MHKITKCKIKDARAMMERLLECHLPDKEAIIS